MQTDKTPEFEFLCSQVATFEGKLSDLKMDIARVEGEMASSWAFQTKEEYETRLKNGIKTELIRYLVTILTAMFAVLAGSGIVFIKIVTSSELESQYRSLASGFESRFSSFLEEASGNSQWQSLHDYGVFQRYMLDFSRDSALSEEVKRECLAIGFRNATDYFKRALRKDHGRASTHWELANLYYFRAKEHEFPDLVRKDDAIKHLEYAIHYYTEDEVALGWRADAYIALMRIRLDSWELTKNLEELQKARKAGQMALRDYEKTNNGEEAEKIRQQLAKLDTRGKAKGMARHG